MKHTIKQLRELPFKKSFSDINTYNSLLVIPSGRKHDSGFALMCVIGVDSNDQPIEIASYCDDIHWKIPNQIEYDFINDMYYPSGVIRFWSNKYAFQVGASLSSTEIHLVPKPQLK